MFREKGFIGVIGDDLPSLLPIIAGLLLFFSTFNTALSTFSEAKTVFENSEKLIQIIKAVRGDNYISSYKDFVEGCAKIPVKGLFYKVALVDSALFRVPESGLPKIEFFDVRRFVLDDDYARNSIAFSIITPEGKKVFLCSKTFNLENYSEEEIKKLKETQIRNLFTRIYPVAFEDRQNARSGLVVRPMFLVITVWK